MYQVVKTETRSQSCCRYCQMIKQCTLYKITTVKGINKKIVTWGTHICDACAANRITKKE